MKKTLIASAAALALAAAAAIAPAAVSAATPDGSAQGTTTAEFKVEAGMVRTILAVITVVVKMPTCGWLKHLICYSQMLLSLTSFLARQCTIRAVLPIPKLVMRQRTRWSFANY
ncbi:hypothetical protein [Lacticaseibacillus nasuensis]|uniref:hypothetical protein n=1 Tax=Lacticaseibacillus nasuensis TaxID=944671 RepID=UPI0006D20B3C|nr:hypothetical protein [Lacticaseibacillus nasuensis]